MREVERRIFLDDELFIHEIEYVYENKRDVPCYVSYYHLKREVETCHFVGNFCACLEFARSRRNDGRYKNYKFFIHIKK